MSDLYSFFSAKFGIHSNFIPCFFVNTHIVCSVFLSNEATKIESFSWSAYLEHITGRFFSCTIAVNFVTFSLTFFLLMPLHLHFAKFCEIKRLVANIFFINLRKLKKKCIPNCQLHITHKAVSQMVCRFE